MDQRASALIIENIIKFPKQKERGHDTSDMHLLINENLTNESPSVTVFPSKCPPSI